MTFEFGGQEDHDDDDDDDDEVINDDEDDRGWSRDADVSGLARSVDDTPRMVFRSDVVDDDSPPSLGTTTMGRCG